MKTVVMCPPTHFEIAYEINPWMHTGTIIDRQAMRREWQHVQQTYIAQLGWHVEQVSPVKGQPDMVFATDNCLMIDGKIMLSNFRYAERRGETAHFETWLREHGFSDFYHATHYFEGGGDNLVCGKKVFAGYGFRSDRGAADELRTFFDREVISLRLVDPYFYHLDTALAVLDEQTIAVYPSAFDRPSLEQLHAAVPHIIEATRKEAQGFALNAVSDGHTIITSDESPSLLAKYQTAGFQTIALPMGEFKKAGGGIKCMTLDIRI